MRSLSDPGDGPRSGRFLGLDLFAKFGNYFDYRSNDTCQGGDEGGNYRDLGAWLK